MNEDKENDRLFSDMISVKSLFEIVFFFLIHIVGIVSLMSQFCLCFSKKNSVRLENSALTVTLL